MNLFSQFTVGNLPRPCFCRDAKFKNYEASDNGVNHLIALAHNGGCTACMDHGLQTL